MKIECVVELRDVVGEGPVWTPSTSASTGRTSMDSRSIDTSPELGN
jgi:hypothetical protein